MKKNNFFKTLFFVIISLCSVTMFSSCEPIEDVLEDIVSDFAVGKTWEDNGYTIKKISYDTYWVVDQRDGYGEVYYLQPFVDALATKPYTVRVLDHWPIIRSEGLRWCVKTNHGEYHVFSGGGWSRI